MSQEDSQLYYPHQASFRDPSGFIFSHKGKVYRQVNKRYSVHYDHMMKSGLYKTLQEKNWLVAHEEVDIRSQSTDAYKVLLPIQIQFTSYPYEWSFSQLKDAALRTLDIQKLSLEYGMCLKDASAYNIQFEDGIPILIDTLSLELYEEGRPWVAYRQFCQHFLAPLALMAKTDIRLSQLLKIHIDGIPLDLASGLLPKRSWLNFRLLMHLHFQAKMQKAYSSTDDGGRNGSPRTSKLSKNGLIGIINSLRNSIQKLDWKPAGTEWAQYYQDTNYSDSSFDNKSRIVASFLKIVSPGVVWDLGANTGYFTRLANQLGAAAIAFDVDPAAVEINYRLLKEKKEKYPLPLLMDLTNPTPGLGWSCTERDPLIKRGPADCVMALALIHHLAISNNVPFERIAEFFSLLGKTLIIEFVPKSDSQVQRLLQSRNDIFDLYSKDHFEKSFNAYFSIVRIENVAGSERTLYLMERIARKQ